MQRAATTLRDYRDADATMRQRMRTMHTHYTTYQAQFAAFNPEFGAAFGTSWLAAIDTADTTPVGAVRVAELKEDTAEVDAVMEQARHAAQSLFYFVGRAFPHNAGRLDQYGRHLYEAARDSHDKMRTLLQTAFTSATRDKTALAAKGYSAAQLAALGDLVEQLTDTNTDQEVKKGANTEGSDQYVTVQNMAYGFGQEVSAAAKVLFAEDQTTLALFRLTTSAPAGPEHHEVSVPVGELRAITFRTPFDKGTVLHLRLVAPQAEQQAALGRVKDEQAFSTYPITLSFDNSAADAKIAELGSEGQVLVVKNTGSQLVRVAVTLLAH